MSTSDRIEEIIKALGYNNSRFAKEIDVSSTTIDGYIKGRRNAKGELVISKPNFDVIKKMCLKFNINAEYILGLSDYMFKNNAGKLENLTNESILDYVINNKDSFKEVPKIHAVTALFNNIEQQGELQKIQKRLADYEKRLNDRDNKSE